MFSYSRRRFLKELLFIFLSLVILGIIAAVSIVLVAYLVHYGWDLR